MMKKKMMVIKNKKSILHDKHSQLEALDF